MNTQDEIQLSADLRTIVADQPFVPDIEVIERHGQRRLRRSFAVRGLAGLAVLSVAVAGGLVAAGHGSGTARESATGKQAASATVKAGKSGTAGAAKIETVGYVRQRIVAAALNPDAYLIKTRENSSSSDGPPSYFTDWIDPRTGNTLLLRGSGHARLAYWEHDYVRNRVLHWEQTQVNYGPRTWFTFDEHAAGPIQGPVPSGPVGGDYFSPAEIKQILDDGTAKIVGHPEVDGHRTVELSITMGGMKMYAIYADTKTYLVVRTIKYFPELSTKATPIQSDYSWLPRSAAMVNRINHPQIPAGFTQVPADKQA